MNTELQDYFNGLCCPEPPITYNFDVDSSDWEIKGITDQASFNSILGVTTDQFLLSGNNIKANILTGPSNLSIISARITNVNYITFSGMTQLYLYNNLITTFNPTKPLPSGLQILNLSGNFLVNFNPTLPLPTSLSSLILASNKMTDSGYTASEPWANGLHTAPSGTGGSVSLQNNIDSVAGTNLETILTSKGWDVLAI